MNLGFLQEKTNPGGFGSLTALSGIMANCINEARLLVCMKLHKQSTHVKISKIIFSVNLILRRHSGLMVSALIPGLSGQGLSPGRGHCVLFLGKTLYSHSASLHPGV